MDSNSLFLFLSKLQKLFRYADGLLVRTQLFLDFCTFYMVKTKFSLHYFFSHFF